MSSQEMSTEIVRSSFRYKRDTTKGEHLMKNCYYGVYYKNAESREAEENLEYECVIMDYGDKLDHARSQIKLSRKMGDEYALQVLHLDNRDNKSVKVVYQLFEDVGGWIKKLGQKDDRSNRSKDKKSLEEWWKKIKAEVIPKIRKLWKLQLKMKKEGIRVHKDEEKPDDPGYSLALIHGGPMILNIFEGEEDLNMNYPVKLFENIVKKNLEGCPNTFVPNPMLPEEVQKALAVWKKIKPSLDYEGYALYSKPAVLYDSIEKLRFLGFFYHCIFVYDVGLKRWLDSDIKWAVFQSEFKDKSNEDVYNEILYHVPGQAQVSAAYSKGSDVVRYTRNTLAHFEKHYYEIKRTPWVGGEIVEVLDAELNVCSDLFMRAITIVEAAKLPKVVAPYMSQKNWDDAKERLRKFLVSLACN